MRLRPRAGFTLIELLIVVVIIGILAAIAIPAYRNTKGRAYAASVRSDLRNLATAEESYFYSSGEYTTDLAALSVTPSQGVTITVGEATAAGWSATASHALASTSTCGVYYGGVSPVAPATVEGRIACD